MVNEWPKPLVHTCLDLNYLGLAHVYSTTVSSMGAVWVVYAYFNENSTHQSETKITDMCSKIVFLILLHYIPHKKCITHCIKYRGHDKYINSVYNRVGPLNMHNAYINENR